MRSKHFSLFFSYPPFRDLRCKKSYFWTERFFSKLKLYAIAKESFLIKSFDFIARRDVQMSLNLETHFRKTFIRRLQRIPQNWIISVFLSINSWLMWFYLSAVVFQEPSAKWSVQAATCSLPTTPFRRKSRPALLFHYFFSIFSTWFTLYSRPMNTSLAFFPLQFQPSGRCARWSRLCTSVSHSHGSRFFFLSFSLSFLFGRKKCVFEEHWS